MDRCNLEETSTGVRLCRGNHERGEPCKWEHFSRSLVTMDFAEVEARVIAAEIDYQNQALRTEAPAPTQILDEAAIFLDWLRVRAKEVGNSFDMLKRHTFYGKPLVAGPVRIGAGATFVIRNNGTGHMTVNNVERIRLLHAALGFMTEACEFLDAVLMPVHDRTNLAEELGDIYWYLALAQSALGVSEESVKLANISKLRIRFPHKFTQQQAVERSLEEEARAVEEKIRD